MFELDGDSSDLCRPVDLTNVSGARATSTRVLLRNLDENEFDSQNSAHPARCSLLISAGEARSESPGWLGVQG